MKFNSKRILLLPGLPSLGLGAIVAAVATIASCSANPNSSTTNQPVVSSSPTQSIPMSKQMPQGMSQGNMMNHSMGMDLGPADANYDLRFIDGMMLHHQGAVVMAQEAQRKSSRTEIKKLAAEIITAQEKEIASMKTWRTNWYASAATTPMGYSSSMGHMMPMSQDQMNSMMMSGDLGAADNQFDLRFVNAMIPHHEGALVMAKDALAKSQRPEIKVLAQAILASQQVEIDQMKSWRKSWYNQ